AGKLQFTSTGSAASSTMRLGDTSGAVNSEIDLIGASGGVTITSLLNPRAGNTGVETVGSVNTSGTNTWSGTLALDHNLAVTQSSGGTLVLSGSTIDIKAQTLSLTGSGGNINITNVISNSTAGGQ